MELAAGRTNACLRLDRGAVACWGINRNGADGDGTRLDPDRPVGVVGLPSPAISICVGAAHACAALEDGSVWCWGGNEAGQIGSGAPMPRGSPSAVRVEASGLNAVVQVACGEAHTCARNERGEVWCWGSNVHGQTGSPIASAPQPMPIRAGALLPVDDVAAGGNVSCAITEEPREVRCWGSGEDGAFGTSRSDPDSAAPSGIVLPDVPSRVAVGAGHVCAATPSGAYCWGRNDHGETGSGFLGINGPVPADVTGFASGVSTGASHTCVSGSEGALRCFGSNAYGQLAFAPLDGPNPSPIPVADTYTAAAAGDGFTCGIRDGRVWCWGLDRGHLLARGDPTHRPTPHAIDGFDGVTEIATGLGHTCFTSAGTMRCCGANLVGQIGNGGVPREESLPQLVAGAPASLFALGAGTDTTCARDASVVWCWGANDAEQGGIGTGMQVLQVATTMGEPVMYDEIEGGRSTMCGRTGGVVHCWGSNARGQLGDGSGVGTRASRTQVAAISGASALAFGDDHACVIEVGSVRCWGAGGDGRLGPSDAGDAFTPITVPDIADALEIGAYGTRTCVVRRKSGIWCWDAGAPDPAPVPGTESAVEVTVGAAHGCFVAVDRSVHCWGSNRAGQLGDGTRTDRATPVRVEHEAPVNAIRAGAEHTCSLADFTVRCWGATGSGRLCDAATVRSEIPAPVLETEP